jgi:MFS family permease
VRKSFGQSLRGPRADFWRLWYVGLVLSTVRWLEMVVVGVVVYDRTGSAFVVATITMLRLLPMGLFGAVLGAMVEHVDRRHALAVLVAAMAVTSGLLCLVAWNGALEVWHLAALSFVNGFGWASDNPVRRVMLGEVVGADRMSTALSVDVGANNASRMIGPTLGGVLLASGGIESVFALSVLLYLTALWSAYAVRYRNRASAAASGAVFARIAEGLRLVRRDQRLIGTLLVTIIYNVFGWPFTSMVPVIGQDQLHLGPEGIGILASMDGIGAFCGAIQMALFVRPRFYAASSVGGVAVYFVMLTAFALIPDPTVAGAALLFTGLGGAGFSIMQATLVYLAAPPEMRSRMLGVLSVCIGIGPIGFVHLGWLADLIGAQWATAASGIEGLVVLALTRRWWRRI